MRFKRRIILLTFGVVMGASLSTGRAQTAPAIPLKYVPPACQGKPITVVPRAVALAQSPTEFKTNPPIAREDQLKLFDALAKIISEVYVYPDFQMKRV